MMNRSPSTRAILALLPIVAFLLMALIWSMASGSVLAQEVTPTPLPTVTPWGGKARRDAWRRGAAPAILARRIAHHCGADCIDRLAHPTFSLILRVTCRSSGAGAPIRCVCCRRRQLQLDRSAGA